MSAEIDLEPLSEAARCIAGGWFGMMVPTKGELTFNLIQSRPSDIAQEALDELVKAGAISVEAFNDLGGLVYRPIVNCRPAYKWLARNQGCDSAGMRLTVPLRDAAEAEAVQRSALAVAA